MRLLDLFCKAGGAAMGYRLAGLDEIVGVDIEPQPHYPFEFIRNDVATIGTKVDLRKFDLIHASPPCQAFSRAQKLRGYDHPDLIGPTRELLLASGKPFIIENVGGAPLRNPVMLCGATFCLGTYRHRFFEVHGFSLPEPEHPAHNRPTTKMGRPPEPGEMMHVVGNFSGVGEAREAMGIGWMTRDELREAVPPAYTKFIGDAFLQQAEVDA